MSDEDSVAAFLDRYTEAVAKLNTDFSRENLFSTLGLRDLIENCLRRGQVQELESVTGIVQTDARLRALARGSYKLRKDLVEWRGSLRPSQDSWWWFLDRVLPGPVKWAERAVLYLSFGFSVLSLGVAIELARRYGGDGIGPGSLLPIAVTLLGSISLGGIVSPSFRDRLTAWLEGAGHGLRWRPLAYLAILIPVILIGGLWFARSRISAYYNHRGVSELSGQRGPRTQLSLARSHLERAVRFDPTNSVAHYNLGRVYEDLLQDDRAATEYQIAFDAGLDLAGNNLGHLYLLRAEYDRAAFVLQQLGTPSAASANNPDPDLRYTELKNLGWARWGQKRYGEARVLLEEAVRVNRDRAEVHCLLAKTLGALHDQGAAGEWRRCLGLTWQSLRNPTQDIWLGEARAFLDGAASGRSQ
ncbi:MAG TPA: tetratricopeptide repeat protein [Thermoanaerobaculia bacterium]